MTGSLGECERDDTGLPKECGDLGSLEYDDVIIIDRERKKKERKKRETEGRPSEEVVVLSQEQHMPNHNQFAKT